MRPIVPVIAALALLAGLTATVFVLMQPAPEAPPAVRIARAEDPRNPYADAARDGIVDGATDRVMNPRFAAHGLIGVMQHEAAEGMER